MEEIEEGNEIIQVLLLFKNQVKVNSLENDIRDVYRIGTEKLTGKIRPILVEQSTYLVFFSESLQPEGQKIFILNDYAMENLAKTKVLSENLKSAS
ncbi:hypothetical protein JTB14_032939 [Gonioctena quinquepunctata]|nr:hypothetical protein JTB14_032939 [Gonioctena quinquepunctata]